jgi:hypothetical protein
VRVEQRVQPAGGRRGLGEEDVAAVELAHVLQPPGVEDARPACHRKGVELPDRGGRVTAQGVEERGLAAPPDRASTVLCSSAAS